MRNGSLVVVGTGFSIAGQVTQEALSHMSHAERLLYLVTDIATKEWLESLNPNTESLYDSYRVGRAREETYAEMSERILRRVRDGERVVAAFYGHPGVFVAPSHLAIAQARAEGFDARMLPGISAEDCLFADVGFDPGERGCQSFEATDFLLRRRIFDPASPLVLWQVGVIGVRDYQQADLWGPRGLEVLMRRLLETYPAEHPAIVYEAAQYPICPPLICTTPIAALTQAPVTVRSTLYVTPLADRATDPSVRIELGLDAEPVG